MLLRRFSETRRPHPLAVNQPAIEGIREEREALRPSARWPTSSSTPPTTRCTSCATTSASTTTCAPSGAAWCVSVMSFGYKYGVPSEADLVFDVRFLPNPNFVPAPEAADRQRPRRWCATCSGRPDTARFLRKLGDFLSLRDPALRRARARAT